MVVTVAWVDCRSRRSRAHLRRRHQLDLLCRLAYLGVLTSCDCRLGCLLLALIVRASASPSSAGVGSLSSGTPLVVTVALVGCSRVLLLRRRQLWRLIASASSLSRLSPWVVRAAGAALLPHRCAVSPSSAVPAVPAVAALCLGVLPIATVALGRPRRWSILAPSSLRCVAAVSCACCGGSLPWRPHYRDCRDCRLGSTVLLERPCSRIAALYRRRQLCLLWRLFASASSRPVTVALVRLRCWSVLAPASLRCVAAVSCACCGGSLPWRPHSP
jgi:hypothetical protein